jgi:hypothetical protein
MINMMRTERCARRLQLPSHRWHHVTRDKLNARITLVSETAKAKDNVIQQYEADIANARQQIVGRTCCEATLLRGYVRGAARRTT